MNHLDSDPVPVPMSRASLASPSVLLAVTCLELYYLPGIYLTTSLLIGPHPVPSGVHT